MAYKENEYGSNYYRGRGRGGSSYRGGRGSDSGYYGSSYRGSSSRGGYYSGYNSGYKRGSVRSGNEEYEASTGFNNDPSMDEDESSQTSYRGRGNSTYRGSSSSSYRGGRRDLHYKPDLNRSSSSTNSSTSNNPHRYYKDIIQEKQAKNNFNNPWIHILEIEDDNLRKNLENQYNELTQLDSEIFQLEKNKLKLELTLNSLDLQAEKEALHAKDLNEKLEDITFFNV